MMSGEDGELGGARKEMDLKLDRLKDATQLAILGNTQEAAQMNRELMRNEQFHAEILQGHMKSIQQTLDESKGMMAKLLKAFEEKGTPPQKRAGAVAQKAASADLVRSAMPQVQGEESEYHILKETIVDGTCTWVFSETAWQTWASQEDASPRILAIVGDPGTGKSHIAASMRDHLRKTIGDEPDRTTYVAHFYFREHQGDLSKFGSAVITAVNQVAEQSDALCEKMCAQLRRQDLIFNLSKWENLLRNFLRHVFDEDSKYRLFLVLDGIDELDRAQRKAAAAFLKRIAKANLRISVAVTSRPDSSKALVKYANAATINVTKTLQLPDIKALVRNRQDSLENLRRFSPYVKQRIADEIELMAPSSCLPPPLDLPAHF